jgi:hypothetical protein
MAHFHIPKPLHGWREFAGEVGIIVLGVLIALGAEQVVEELQWRHKVAVVRNSLTGELANDRARWELDLATARCDLVVINKLDAWAQAGAPGGSKAVTGSLGGSELFWMHAANWNLATSSQSLDHFPMQEQPAFGALYDAIAHRQIALEKASDLIGRIETLVPLSDDAGHRSELQSAIGSLRWVISSLLDNEGYMKRHFDAVGVKPDRSDLAADISRLDKPLRGCRES